MAQRRMLSRRISQSKKVNKLSLKAQLVYTWTIPYLDDYGCYIADPEDIKDEVFIKNRRISVADIRNSIIEIRNIKIDNTIGLIWLYKVGDKYYQKYKKFDEFQTFKGDRERVSEYPPFSKELEVSGFQVETSGFPNISKDNITKENIVASEEATPFFLPIKDYFVSAYKKKFGKDPAIDFGKDGKNVKAKQGLFIDLNDAYRLIDGFLDSKKAEECGYTLSVCFSSHTINLWRAGKFGTENNLSVNNPKWKNL